LPFSYYIYYRVAQPGQARTLAARVLADLKNKTGIEGRLLTKRNDPATWMEVYEDVRDARTFEECLAATVQEMNFGSILEAGGERHLECFENSCA